MIAPSAPNWGRRQPSPAWPRRSKPCFARETKVAIRLCAQHHGSRGQRCVHEAFISAGATAVFAKDEAVALRDHLLAAATVG
jgi:hypothetical protein